MPMGPLRNIFRLVTGDAFAKALTFLAFVWLARSLGVERFGTLEFALSLLTWLLILADGGLEIWATREAARGVDPSTLVGFVVPMRLTLAGGAFIALLGLLPALPDFPSLTTVILLFSFVMPVQAMNLKWVFMGRERLGRVGATLAVGQLVFAAAVFMAVRDPSHLVRVPLARLAADSTMAMWFGVSFLAIPSRSPVKLSLRPGLAVLRPALALGGAHALATASFNFDSLLLGFLATVEEVGLYAAAYKPIVASLALPVAYFSGLYPTLVRSLTRGDEAFRSTARSSLRLTWAFAVPVGIGSYFFARDGLITLFGEPYAAGATALQILGISAVLVILRGTYRQGLLASNRVRIDLACGGVATLSNILMNFWLIPRFGIEGAASATLASEVLWLTLITYMFNRRVASVSLVSGVTIPLGAGAVMTAVVIIFSEGPWIVRAIVGVVAYVSSYAVMDGLRRRSPRG